uniref:NR LBD domain-containing protein n=1 Tax=Rhabditophanes sp. KR3021 TaxID=114890 RepID=A0AC35U0U6_9BILA
MEEQNPISLLKVDEEHSTCPLRRDKKRVDFIKVFSGFLEIIRKQEAELVNESNEGCSSTPLETPTPTHSISENSNLEMIEDSSEPCQNSPTLIVEEPISSNTNSSIQIAEESMSSHHNSNLQFVEDQNVNTEIVEDQIESDIDASEERPASTETQKESSILLDEPMVSLNGLKMNNATPPIFGNRNSRSKHTFSGIKERKRVLSKRRSSRSKREIENNEFSSSDESKTMEEHLQISREKRRNCKRGRREGSENGFSVSPKKTKEISEGANEVEEDETLLDDGELEIINEIQTINLDTHAIAKAMVKTLHDASVNFENIYEDFREKYFHLTLHAFNILLYRPIAYKKCTDACKHYYYLMNNMIFSSNQEGRKLIIEEGYYGVADIEFPSSKCNHIPPIAVNQICSEALNEIPLMDENIFDSIPVSDKKNDSESTPMINTAENCQKDIYIKNRTKCLAEVDSSEPMEPDYELLLELMYYNSFNDSQAELIPLAKKIGEILELSLEHILDYHTNFKLFRESFVENFNFGDLRSDAITKWEQSQQRLLFQDDNLIKLAVCVLHECHLLSRSAMPNIKEVITLLRSTDK